MLNHKNIQTNEFKGSKELGIVAHTYNSSSWEAGVEGVRSRPAWATQKDSAFW